MSSKYQKVYIAFGHLEAETIRLFLEANGIPVETRQEAAGPVYGLTVGPLGKVTIFVPEERLEEATGLLEQMEEGELILPDDEPLIDTSADLEDSDLND